MFVTVVVARGGERLAPGETAARDGRSITEWALENEGDSPERK
jgi:hypothetical protein